MCKADILLWILEDDPGLRFVYAEMLESLYKLRFFESLAEFSTALSKPEDELPTLVIADLKLPDGSFLDFLSSTEERAAFDLAFLVVSSVDEVETLRACFDGGALDYLCKPFQRSELLVKIERAVSTTCRPAGQPQRSLIGLELEKILPGLTLTEQKIISVFLAAVDRTATRSELNAQVWPKIAVHGKTLDVHLHNIRRKLRALGWDLRVTAAATWTLSREGMDR